MLRLPNELLGCVVDECLFAAAIALGQACTVTRAAVDARKQHVAVECGCPVPTTGDVRVFWTFLNENENESFYHRRDAMVKHRPMVKYLAALGAFGEVPAGWTCDTPCFA